MNIEKQTGVTGIVVIDTLLKGNYTINEVQPETVTDGPEVVGNMGGGIGPDLISDIQLVDNANGYAFLEYGWKISGKVFVDFNKDGAFDGQDYGISGVSVSLTNVSITLPHNAKVLGINSFTTITDSNGNYDLVEVQPSLYLTNNANLFKIQILNNDSTGNIFTEIGGKIAGFIFNDLNGKGIQDNNESNVSGIEVILNDENGLKYSSMITDGEGEFTFSGLPAGKYFVTIPNFKYSKDLSLEPAEEILGISVAKSNSLSGTGRDWPLFKIFR